MRSGISATAAPDRAGLAWQPIAALAAAGLAIAIAWALGTDRVDQATLAARYSARVSLALFLLLYLWRPPSWRRWYLGFATPQAVHLATMIALFAVERRVPHALTLAGGGVGAILLLALVVGRRERLRDLVLGYLWLAFAATYLGRLFDHPDRRAAGVFALVLVIGAGAIRRVTGRRGA